MTKTMGWICISLILAGIVIAAEGNTLLLNLHYDNGNITLLDQKVKYGFYPDRRYQPPFGYKAEIIGIDNSILYDFNFKVPIELYVDGTDSSGNISGGKILLNNTDFALIMPYYKEMKEVRLYNQDEEQVAEFNFREKAPITIYIIGVISLILILILITAVLFKRRKPNS